ncbi:excisionase family DNA-binding protein [Methylobacterium dankookense]|uniref:excisionase family DNA-binding protein n=1 Tax=Methylobacterium dankookense TaxID=560405 RepID=UPI001643DFFA|nr:excisionase family DNA-binding protein [Methylobacterium dankookense]
MSTNFKPEDWISQAEAARLRGVSRQAIFKLIRSERLRSLEVGGHVLINREDVANFTPKKAGRPKSHG